MDLPVWELVNEDLCGDVTDESLGRFDMMDATVVVTGANSGIGFETARMLALMGAKRVILGCRSGDKCEMAKVLIDAGECTKAMHARRCGE